MLPSHQTKPFENKSEMPAVLHLHGGGMTILTASDPNYVYAVISKNSPSKAEWLARTSDGGTTWETLGVPRDDIVYTGSDCAFGDCSGQAGYSMSFAVDPTNPNVLYGGGLDVYKSTDGGNNWTQITDGLSSSVPYMHVDQHGIEFAGGNVIFSNDGGVFFSNNAMTMRRQFTIASRSQAAKIFRYMKFR